MPVYAASIISLIRMPSRMSNTAIVQADWSKYPPACGRICGAGIRPAA